MVCLASQSTSSRRVFFKDEPALIAGNKPAPVDLSVLGDATHGRVNSKKAKSPKSSPTSPSPNKVKSPKGSPGLVALLMDSLELPSALVKGAQRAEIEHRNRSILLSRCSRYTLAAQRAPRLFHARGKRAAC